MAPNAHKLVDPGWVADLVAGGSPGTAGWPPTYPGKGYVILEINSAKGTEGTAEYNSGHIPGAIHLNTNSWQGGWPVSPYRNPTESKMLPDAQLQAAIEKLGISWDKTVVVYPESSGATTAAARIAWMLMYTGVADVRILNGGKAAWQVNGGAQETTPNKGAPVAFGATVPLHPEYLATAADVRAAMEDRATVLGDIRRREEFIGAPGSNTYANTAAGFTAEGRIPGAVWLWNASDYLNADGTFRSYAEVQQFWRDQGVTPDKKLIFY